MKEGAPEARQLRDAYRFKGFTPSTFVLRHPKDPLGWVIDLRRRGKGGSVAFAERRVDGMTTAPRWFETWIAEAGTFTCGSR